MDDDAAVVELFSCCGEDASACAVHEGNLRQIHTDDTVGNRPEGLGEYGRCAHIQRPSDVEHLPPGTDPYRCLTLSQPSHVFSLDEEGMRTITGSSVRHLT